MNSLKKNKFMDIELLCAHIHHQLRGTEADSDEQFVTAKCDELGLPIEKRRIDVKGYAAENKLSTETAARALRISALIEIAKNQKCCFIATGHHADDNAETLLQRLARGTSYRGLSGIWPCREFEEGIQFIRPMLGIRRKDIIEYLNKKQVDWCIDKTNEYTEFRRNFIRHILMPELQKEWEGDLVESLSKLSNHSRQLQVLVEKKTAMVWADTAWINKDNVKLALESFLKQPKAVQVELIRRSLKTIGSGERSLTEEHYNSILQLAAKNSSGKKLELPGRFIVRRDYQQLIFEKTQKPSKSKKVVLAQDIAIPGTTHFADYIIEAEYIEAKKINIDQFITEKDDYVELFDVEKLHLPLNIRFRQAGDRFQPLGFMSQKRVGKFLTSAKTPDHIRQKLVVISDNKGIIWIWPVRMSEKHKVTKATKTIIRLKIKHIPEI
jgi:tRNA(Ile)-lysidine synthase